MYAYDVLSELGLRTRTEFGDRVARGLVPLGEFTELETCCHSDCAHVLGAVGAGHQDDEYSKLTTEKDQDLYLLTTVLWSSTFWRPSSVCNLHLRRLFGLSPRRIARLRAIICDLVLQESPMTHDGLVEAGGGHGNGGSTPHNKTPDHFRAIIFRIYELHTRPDPVKPVLHVMAEGCLGGVASLVHRALEEAPETPDGKFKSPSNLRRLADQKCLACGCTRFSVHEAAHNACGLCCGFEVTHDRETKAAIALKENEVTLKVLGHGMSMLRTTSTPWRVAALTAEGTFGPLVRVGYKPGQCVGLNCIAMDADTAATMRLPAATMVAAELGVPMGDPAIVFTDSPPSPLPPVAPDSPFAPALAKFASEFGGPAAERMENRLTVGKVFEFLGDNVSGLVPLTEDRIGATLRANFNDDHFFVFQERLRLQQQQVVLPEKPASAYRIFYRSRKAFHDEAVEEPEATAESVRQTRHQIINKEWASLKAQPGGDVEWAAQAASEKDRLGPEHERWLKEYHSKPSPLPLPWTREALDAAKVSSEAAKKKRKAPPPAPAATAAIAATAPPPLPPPPAAVVQAAPVAAAGPAPAAPAAAAPKAAGRLARDGRGERRPRLGEQP